MKSYRKSSDLPLSRQVKSLAGRVIKLFRPQRAAEIFEKPFDPRWGRGDKLMRNAHLVDAVHRQEHPTLLRFLRDYWASTASTSFYDTFSHRFEDLFLRHHSGIVEHVQKQASRMTQAGKAVRLVEVGSGDGRLLHHLSRCLPGISEFHGIDVNPDQIARCQAAHRDEPRLTFHHAEALQWLQDRPHPGTIVLTNGGVLEYFLREQLSELLRHLCDSQSPAAVAITETVATDHSFETEPASYPYSRELALSHNYGAILKEAGWQVTFERDRPTEPGEENHPTRWIQMVATCGC